MALSGQANSRERLQTLAPGCRLGYFVCNPLFAERLLRATEVATQTPSGWSQAIVMSHLAQWGMDGYLTWLSNLCEQYRVRRDWLVGVGSARGRGGRADDHLCLSVRSPGVTV